MYDKIKGLCEDWYEIKLSYASERDGWDDRMKTNFFQFDLKPKVIQFWTVYLP